MREWLHRPSSSYILILGRVPSEISMVQLYLTKGNFLARTIDRE
jgi:hypothetical protein